MKTVFINCSPKKKFCASAYFLFLQSLSVKGKKVTEKLRNPSNHQRILEQIRDEIIGLDVNNLTPLEALNKLSQIKKIIKG